MLEEISKELLDKETLEVKDFEEIMHKVENERN
jgi:ATP-dependent Zn protease